MDISLFSGFEKMVREQNLGVYGAHVYKKGQGSAEIFFRDNERVHLFSGSKAFASVAVGIAEGEGRLSLSDCVLSYFPQYKKIASDGAEKITVRDLLQMRAGHAKPLFSTDPDTHERELDWAQLFFMQSMDYAAGTRFFYDNGCTYMLSRIIEAVSGCTLRDYLMPRLFAPMDIFNPQWHTCPKGHTLGAVGLYLKCEEFSRLGRLLLDNGMWEGQEIVPENYIERAWQDTVEVCGFSDSENKQGYGYQLWRCTVHGAYRADGKHGQYSIILPDKQAVVTVTAHNENSANDILRAVWKEILPEI